MRVIKFCLILLIVYSVVLFSKVKFDNGVDFSGDGWEYQTMAVNWAKGYGLMKVGGMAGDYHQDYKFYKQVDEMYQPTLNRFIDFGIKGGNDNFYRTPGYIFFLGGIYKLFGIQPQIAKQAQLFLIIMIAAFLPYIGYFYWKKSGLLAGLTAGITYLNQYAHSAPKNFALSYPSQIMTETLVAFNLFLLVLGWIYWQKGRNPQKMLLIGLIVGASLLVKGTNIFLPLIILTYLTYLIIGKKIAKCNLVTFILGLLISILPWSYYASKASGELIFLSTQSEAVLLDNNNQYAVDGGWHPEGYSHNPDSFYRQPEIKSLSLPFKLLLFYAVNPQMVPDVFLAKIRLGFENHLYLKTALILIELKLLSQLMLEWIRNKKIKINQKYLKMMVIIIGASVIYFFRNRWWLMEQIRQLLYVDRLMIGLIMVVVLAVLINKRALKIDFPIPLAILWLNYLLLTIATLGWPRLNQVIDFSFMLLTFQYVLDYGKFLWSNKVSVLMND